MTNGRANKINHTIACRDSFPILATVAGYQDRIDNFSADCIPFLNELDYNKDSYLNFRYMEFDGDTKDWDQVFLSKEKHSNPEYLISIVGITFKIHFVMYHMY